MRTITTRLILLVFLNSLMIPFSSANEIESSDLFSLSLKELLTIKVSSPTLTEESLVDTPSAITVFTRREIKRLGIDFLHELLNLTPGFQVSREADHAAAHLYSSRGSETGAGSVDILLLINGMRHQEVRTGSASRLSAFISVDKIEQIEIIRGPGSALYGSNAFFGVINIRTVKGVNIAETKVGNLGRKSVNLALSKKVDDFQADISITAYQDDGEDYNIPDGFSGAIVSTDDPKKAKDVAVRLQYNNTLLFANYSSYHSDNFYSFEIVNDEINTEEQVFFNVGIEQNFHYNGVDSKISLYQSQDNHDFSGQASGPGIFSGASAPDSDAPLLGSAAYEGKIQQLKILNDWTINQISSLQFGGEWRNENLKVAENMTNFNLNQLLNGDFPIGYDPSMPFLTTSVTPNDRIVRGIYGQYQYSFGSTKLTAGVRHDNYSSMISNTSLRLGVVSHINKIHTFKLLYGEAFRAPSLQKLYQTAIAGASGNNELGPETVKTVDLIWMGQWSSVSVIAGYFNSHVEDGITAGIIDGIRTSINIQKEKSNGLEFEITAELSTRWSLRSTLTRYFELPDSSYREAKTLASMMLNYNRGNWNFNIFTVYQGEKEMDVRDERIKVESFATVNTKIVYAINNDFKLSFQAKNLFDSDNRSPAQGDDIESPIPNRGLELSVGASYQF